MLGVTGLASCSSPLFAPSGSTVTLVATANSVQANGSMDLVAVVIESAGTGVHDGTTVTFLTTLGRIEPAEALTKNGRATVRFIADGRSGTATITA